MLRGAHRKHIRFCPTAWLFLLGLVFIVPAIPRAEEKTPPYYPEGYRGKSGSDVDIPIKDFPSLFKKAPAASGTDKKPSPQYREARPESPVLSAKPDIKDPGLRPPGIDEGTFQTQEYVVQEGDWLVKILREKGLIKDQNLPELLSLLRKLNSSLRSLDMIQPGEKIVILVKVVPGSESEEETPRDLKYETYRVKRGDILSRVAMRRYNISKEQFSREYLKLFLESNPSIKDPNKLLVGQVIRLPVYPATTIDIAKKPPVMRDLEKSPHGRVALKAPAIPERVQPPRPRPPLPPKTPPPPPAPVKVRPAPDVKDTPPPPQSWPTSLKPVTPARIDDSVRSGRGGQATIIITDGLGTVISRMGEEWVNSGEHFIPMASGGHINLDAQSYPIVRLQQGITVIVDVHSALPQKMSRVLESTWANYRVVRLSPSDDLRSALDKILNAFSYPKAFKKGDPLTLGGAVPVSITGDWIIAPPETRSGKGPKYVVINLMDGQSRGLPRTIKNYLKLLGVEVIEYPQPEEGPSDGGAPASTARTAEDPAALIAAVLNLMAQPFTSQKNIPAYATRNEDFKFTVKADFYLEIRGRRHIIDLGGLGSDVVSLLKDNGVSVLSLAQNKDPVDMVSKVLEFLNVHFDRGPHVFMAKKEDMSRNVKLTLSGITFHDHKGNSVLVTSVDLPPEIVSFLSQRGYNILVLSPLAPSGAGSA